MSQAHIAHPELPNLVSILADRFKAGNFSAYLRFWENIIFSLIIVAALSLFAYLSCRRIKLIPGRLQGTIEIIVGGIDDFICAILGDKGRRYTPFIGTLFLYIFFMNLSGIIPFMKSPTASWSTTLALAICVFFYVQYAAIKESGFLGYLDHLAGKPRGALAFSFIIPLLLFFMHIASELIRPVSLSLRLRSNIWGDDMLFAVLANFGIAGVPLLVFNTLLLIIFSLIQAAVFSLLSTIYFALVLPHYEEEESH